MNICAGCAVNEPFEHRCHGDVCECSVCHPSKEYLMAELMRLQAERDALEQRVKELEESNLRYSMGVNTVPRIRELEEEKQELLSLMLMNPKELMEENKRLREALGQIADSPALTTEYLKAKARQALNDS